MKRSYECFGHIKACKLHSIQCKYKCCVFTNNYIVLYPGEFESSHLNKNHLRIIDNNYFGGKKAICLRKCTKDDLKPLDCESYPYFPRINQKGVIKILKGKKCPLTKTELEDHKELFIKIWGTLAENTVIFEWLKKVELVEYEKEE